MPGPFDNLLGVHGQALPLHRARLDKIAANIANADTPGYKARDLDFAAALAAHAGKADAGTLARTSSRHLGAGGAIDGVSEVFRVPMQPSRDGNTVELAQENAAFAEASMRYQASLTFVERRLRSLMTAITGE